MAEWREQYVNRCESGFYDQGGKSEFTIPLKTSLFYIHDPDHEGQYDEPETDAKDKEKGQPEVYEGRFSCVIMNNSSTGTAWLVTDPIYVQNGRIVRGSAMYMHVFDNANGGARAGMVDGDGPFTGDFARYLSGRGEIESAVMWGGWQGTYGVGELPNRQWIILTTPEIIPKRGFVRLCVQFNADNPGFSAGHFDVFRVEQYTEGSEPSPIPGDKIRVEVTGPGGGPIKVSLVSS